MLKQLEAIHRLLCGATGVIVLMIVKRKFSRIRTDEIIAKLENAVGLLRELS